MVSKFVQIFLFVLGIFKEGFKLKTQIEYNHRWDVSWNLGGKGKSAWVKSQLLTESFYSLHVATSGEAHEAWLGLKIQDPQSYPTEYHSQSGLSTEL